MKNGIEDSNSRKEELRIIFRKMQISVICGNSGQNADGQVIEGYRQDFIAMRDQLRKSTDVIAPILRTALVINWRERAMEVRYARFCKLYPKIKTLNELKSCMPRQVRENTDIDKKLRDEIVAFCKDYLDINVDKDQPHRNPKYRLLQSLVHGFLEYQKEGETEIAAIRRWCESFQDDGNNVRTDFIGSRDRVGIGSIENIRLNLGYPVVKPDRHVIGVMEHCFNAKIPLHQYINFAMLLDPDPRYADHILFKYGQQNNISQNTTAATAVRNSREARPAGVGASS